MAALVSELIASLCTVGILYNLPFPLFVRAIMLIVVVSGSGVKLAIFDGKPFGIILINGGYKIISRGSSKMSDFGTSSVYCCSS
jgi:hypothetical protein